MHHAGQCGPAFTWRKGPFAGKRREPLLPAWRDKGDGGLCLQKLGDKLRFLLEQPTEGAFVPVTDQSDAEAL